MFTLRQYQTAAVDKAIAYFFDKKNKKSQIIVAPTGAGKSLIIANIAIQINVPILVIQPSKELLEQNYAKFLAYGGVASVFSASMKSKEVGNVTFATPQSLRGKEELFSDVKLVIIDEAHLQAKPDSIMAKFIKAIKVNKIIGLTATPLVLNQSLDMGPYLTMMNRSRKNFFQDILHVTQIDELVKDKYWSDIEYHIVNTDSASLKLKSTGSGFTDNSVKRYFIKNDIGEQIVNTCKKVVDPTIVFMPLVDIAETLSGRVKGSAVVSAKTPAKERSKIIEDFKSGVIKVVFNCEVLGVGFDFPELKIVIDAKPSNSIAKVYQRWGRVVRPHPNKDAAQIVDFSGNYNRFGDIRNLVFQDIPGWGWAMTSGDYCITNQTIGEPVLISELALKKSKADSDTAYSTIPVAWMPGKIPFGKYKDKPIEQVVREDVNYINWLLGLADFSWTRYKGLKKQILAAVEKVKLEKQQ